MGVSRTFKAVIPRTFKGEAARLMILRKLDNLSDDAIRWFQVTTETWNHQPEFTRSLSGRYGEEPSITIETDDEIYSYLNYGTSVRLVGVSSDWKSKTQPGQLIPGPGAGEITHPGTFPGIEARHFDEEVAKVFEPSFQASMTRVMRDAAKASGHGG